MSQLSAVDCCSYSLLKTFEGECKQLCLLANEHNGFVQVNTCHEAEQLNYVSSIHVFIGLLLILKTFRLCSMSCNSHTTTMLHYSCCPCNNNSTFLGQLRSC